MSVGRHLWLPLLFLLSILFCEVALVKISLLPTSSAAVLLSPLQVWSIVTVRGEN